jgi:hypothetical protein
MPVSAIDLVKKLMAKAGVTHAGDLTNDIPDEVATALDNQLLTIAAATNNHPDVKKVYFSQAYNGLDTEMGRLMDELNLPENIREEIQQAGVPDGKSGTPTTKRIVALVKKIKEISEKSVPADAAKAKEMQTTIAELHAKVKAEIDKQGNLQKEYDDKIRKIEVRTKIEKELSKYKTVYDDLDPVAKDAAIHALLNKSLQDIDADFTFDKNGNLSLVKKDGDSVFGDNHTLVTPQSFMDKALSKILKVTDPSKGNNPPAAPLPGNSNTSQPNTALKAALADNLQAYEAAAKSAIAV